MVAANAGQAAPRLHRASTHRTAHPDGSVGRLLAELRLLSQRSQAFAIHDQEAVPAAGSPTSDAPIEVTGRFGLAIMLRLAQTAAEHRQPLIMDY